MSINRKELEEIAALAQLIIPDEEAEQIIASLNQVMGMIEHIKKTDTNQVLPMANPNDEQQLIRADVITDDSHKDALLKLAANADDDHYLVPKVIE